VLAPTDPVAPRMVTRRGALTGWDAGRVEARTVTM
jgi:hypothetical protein